MNLSNRLFALSRMTILCWIVFVSFCFSAGAQNRENRVRVENVRGSAQIYNGDIVMATDAAVRVALHRAIENAVGVEIVSERFVDHGVMLSDVVHAYSEGYVEQWMHAENSPRRIENTIYVELDAWVSQKIRQDFSGIHDKIRQRMSDPKGIIVYVSETLHDSRSDRSEPLLIPNMLQRELQGLLAREGYKVWFLPQAQGDKIQKAIEGFAGGGTQNLLSEEPRLLVQSVGLRELADVFVVGKVDLKLRDFRGNGRYPRRTNLVTVAPIVRLNLLRIDSENDRVEVNPLPILRSRGIHSDVDKAIGLAVGDTMKKTKPLIEQVKKWVVAPNRSTVIIYAEGLPELVAYENLQGQLRGYSLYGVENVRGVAFDEKVSRIILTFSRESLSKIKLTSPVEIVASAIDADQNYRVIKKGESTIYLRYKR